MFNPFKWLIKRWSRQKTVTPAQPVRLASKHYDVYALPPPKLLPSDEQLGLIRHASQHVVVKPCEHRDVPRTVHYRVFDTDVKWQILMRCPDCTQTLLEIIYERCAACDKAIELMDWVAISWVGAPQPYTHGDCAESQMLFCGRWGVGRLLRLHEINDQYNEEAVTVAHDSEIDLARELAEAPDAERDTGEFPAVDEDDEDGETPPEGTPTSKPGTN